MSAIKEKNNKNALITGAAKRIGASISRNIHDAGYNVGIHYNSQRKMQKNYVKNLMQKEQVLPKYLRLI